MCQDSRQLGGGGKDLAEQEKACGRLADTSPEKEVAARRGAATAPVIFLSSQARPDNKGLNMANDSVSFSGPVTVRSDAASRVAFDLMVQIHDFEDKPAHGSRDYWLKLYRQWYLATHGNRIEAVQKGE